MSPERRGYHMEKSILQNEAVQLGVQLPIKDSKEGEQIFFYLYVDKKYKGGPQLKVNHVRLRRPDEPGFGEPEKKWKTASDSSFVTDLSEKPARASMDRLVDWLILQKDLSGLALIRSLPEGEPLKPISALLEEGISSGLITKEGLLQYRFHTKR